MNDVTTNHKLPSYTNHKLPSYTNHKLPSYTNHKLPSYTNHKLPSYTNPVTLVILKNQDLRDNRKGILVYNFGLLTLGLDHSH
ncbi:hypothetical protein Pcinc_037401 [Petrolisthes cinctipes]|uniref:Uncharacterized protein n=1 Tax=Petrolisthes cinctipes TaxID=88211 RepID=A0AAE1BSY3_PETCI|nr:hypothetical protein Pcinc_037401 [Petrolisthes cinctipes]